MQIKQLETFVEVVQSGSFSAVAERWLINPTSISRSIQSLESELGFKLLRRSTRQLTLTEAGETYYQKIQPILESLRDAQQAAADTQNALKGTLRMTLPIGFTEAKLMQLLPEFRATHPELNLELIITDECLDLVHEKIDVAVRIGQIQEPNWVAHHLLDFEFILCASPDFIREHNIQTPEDLKQVNAISFIPLPQAQNWCFQSQKDAKHIKHIWIQQSILATNEQTAKTLCLTHQGVALLPNWLVEEDLKSGSLVPLLSKYRGFYKDEQTSTWLIYPNREYVPAKTRAAIRFFKDKLKKI